MSEVGGKKLEKLNVRLSAQERESILNASARGGYASISTWARDTLLAAADAAGLSKPARDVAIYVASDQILFATDSKDDDVVVPIKDIVVEGQVVDSDGFCEAVRFGLGKLAETCDIRRANVVVTGRILPSVTPHIRELVRKSYDVAGVFTMELLMAQAVGAGLEVRKLQPFPVIVVEDDWIEAGVVRGAGLQRKLSIGTRWLSGEERAGRIDALVRDYRQASDGADVLVVQQGRESALSGVRQTFPIVRVRPLACF